MRIVTLAADDIIDGKPRVRGEVVAVPDSYTGNVRRVIAERIEQRNRGQVEAKKEAVESRKEGELFRGGLEKLQAILQADFPQFWAALQKKPAVQEAIIAEMRENPNILRKALEDTRWFVDMVTERLGGKNAK